MSREKAYAHLIQGIMVDGSMSYNVQAAFLLSRHQGAKPSYGLFELRLTKGYLLGLIQEIDYLKKIGLLRNCDGEFKL